MENIRQFPPRKRSSSPITPIGSSARPISPPAPPTNPIVAEYWRRLLFGEQDHLSPLPHEAPIRPNACPRCSGMGFYHLDVPVGHPDFGRRQLCDCQHEQIETKRQAKAQHIAELPPKTQNMTFTSFERNLDADTQRAYDAAWAFVYDEEAPEWLFFTGNPGGGKTHLMAAIARTLLEQQEQVMFRLVPELLDWLRAGFHRQTIAERSRFSDHHDEESDHFQWRFDEVKNIPVLLLDDLGTEQATPWVQEKLFQILNYRYSSRLRTVLSTNRRLGDFDERLQSRLCDAAVCESVATTTTDYRDRPERRQQRTQRTRGSQRGSKADARN